VQFGVNEMNLTQVWLCRVAGNAMKMLHRHALMRVVLHAEARQ
jgi:hypothetical protein